MKLRKTLLSLFLALALILTACGNKEDTKEQEVEEQQEQENEQEEEQGASDDTEKKELIVYSGAGLKKSMEEIKEAFEKEYPEYSLHMIYAGSGQLLAQLEESGKGDVFIVGSKATFDDAMEKDLTNEGVPVAHHTPCIVVQKDNPLNIQSLEDLQGDVKLALGDPDANAIGKTAVKIFEKNGLAGLEDQAVVKTGTVNELYLAMEAGNADAAIVTKDGAFNNQEVVDIIEIPDDQNIDQIITASTLKTSEDEEGAQKFIDFLTNETSLESWNTHGFKPVK